MALIEGKIYLCADGEVRRLDEVASEYLRYSMPIDKRDGEFVWTQLPTTRRDLIETDFLNGKVL